MKIDKNQHFVDKSVKVSSNRPVFYAWHYFLPLFQNSNTYDNQPNYNYMRNCSKPNRIKRETLSRVPHSWFRVANYFHMSKESSASITHVPSMWSFSLPIEAQQKERKRTRVGKSLGSQRCSLLSALYAIYPKWYSLPIHVWDDPSLPLSHAFESVTFLVERPPIVIMNCWRFTYFVRVSMNMTMELMEAGVSRFVALLVAPPLKLSKMKIALHWI
jgi:hypothetical protein